MIYIGCISGTSVDALDLAAVDINENGMSVLHAAAAELPKDLRSALLNLGQPEPVTGAAAADIENMARLDADLGQFIGEQVLQFIHDNGLNPAEIAAVGSHGQTIRHRPGQFTLQIGDPNRIVEACGITTVADFRRRDTAAGGQGAPLVPPFHQALFGTDDDHESHTAVLNVGGISNLTLLGSPPRGFDTGPGNGLLDSWCAHHTGETFDHNGQWATSGTLDTALLRSLLNDPYFAQPPPKSTGREYFNLQWLQPLLQNQSPADVQNTLTELTACCVMQAVESYAPETTRLVVCGGGRLNGFLMQRLQAQPVNGKQIEVVATEAVGVDGDSLEAAAFAWLAYRTTMRQPGNEPAVTGAAGYRLLGGVYYP